MLMDAVRVCSLVTSGNWLAAEFSAGSVATSKRHSNVPAGWVLTSTAIRCVGADAPRSVSAKKLPIWRVGRPSAGSDRACAST